MQLLLWMTILVIEGHQRSHYTTSARLAQRGRNPWIEEINLKVRAAERRGRPLYLTAEDVGFTGHEL